MSKTIFIPISQFFDIHSKLLNELSKHFNLILSSNKHRFTFEDDSRIEFIDDLVSVDLKSIEMEFVKQEEEYSNFIYERSSQILKTYPNKEILKKNVESVRNQSFFSFLLAHKFRKLAEIRKISTVLVSAEYSFLSRSIVIEAKKLGIPSIDVEHGNFLSILNPDVFKDEVPTNYRDFISDFILVDNNLEATNLEVADSQSRQGKYLPLGAPFDNIKNEKFDVEKIKTRLGIQSSQKIISIFGSWAEARTIGQVFQFQLDEADFIEYNLKRFSELKKKYEYILIIKLHPSFKYFHLESTKKYIMQLAKQYNVENRIIISIESANEIVSISDYVIASSVSSVVWESIKVSTPTAIILPSITRNILIEDKLVSSNILAKENLVKFLLEENDFNNFISQYESKTSRIKFAKNLENLKSEWKIDKNDVEQNIARICAWIENEIGDEEESDLLSAITASINSIEKSKEILVSIIIPVFNKVELTEKCLASVYENTNPEIKYEIIVVDNASTDNTKELINQYSEKHNNFVPIINKENKGFAAANNQGANVAKGKYIVLLNNDTECHKNWLKPLLDVIENDEEVAAVGSKLLFPDGTIQHAGVVIINDKKLPDPLVGRHLYYRANADHPDVNRKKTYQALTAACLLIKKEYYDKVGGLDENYWNGYEDVDLCFKLGMKGLKLVYQPESVITHYESQSGPERFAQVGANIELLHKKWISKIKPDFVIEPDGKVFDNLSGKISKYPVTSMVEEVQENVDSVNNIKVVYFSVDPEQYACTYLRIIQNFGICSDSNKIVIESLVNVAGEKPSIDFTRIIDTDIIIIQRHAANFLPWNNLQNAVSQYCKKNVKIIFEIDDALTKMTDNFKDFEFFKSASLHINEYLTNADLVTVSTKTLAKYYESLNNNIVVVPNKVPLLNPNVSYTEKGDGEKVTILMSGTQDHQNDLEIITKAIQKVISEYKEAVQFIFWGFENEDLLKNAQCSVFDKFIPDYKKYLEELSKLKTDFAIVPLIDNEFNRAKSNIKWLEYSINSIPGIYSNVGEYSESIESNKTGILVNNTVDNWYNAIVELISDKNKRKNIAENAFNVVLSKYTATNNNKLLNEITKLVNSQQQESFSKLVSIIIPTFNQWKYTKQTIESIEKFTNVSYEIVIVDNASTDETREKLTAHKHVRLILNDKNEGFPKAVNKGIVEATGEYVMIANNDIVVTEGWLDRMIELIESDTQIGIVGPISNSVSGYQIDENSNYKSIPEMHTYAKSVRIKNKGKVLDFPRVAFLCTLIKKEVIDKIGGLDERFSPGNYEDDDYCLRAQLAGFKTVIAQDVFIHHFGSKSFKADGDQKYIDRLNTNKEIFVEKWGADPNDIWLHSRNFNNRKFTVPISKNKFKQNFERGMQYIEEQELELAAEAFMNTYEFYDEFIETSGYNVPKAEVLNLAGNVFLSLNLFESAKILFENQLKLEPESGEACLGLGQVFLEAELYEQSKVMFEYAVAYLPNNQTAILGLQKTNQALGIQDNYNVSADDNLAIEDDIEELINKGELIEAKLAILDKLSLNGEDTSLLNNLTVINIMQEKYNEAAALLEKILKLAPEDEVALNNLQFLEEKINGEMQSNGTSESITLDEIENLIENGELKTAKEALKNILLEDSQNLDALNNLVVLLILEGKYDKASEAILEILKIDPTNETARNNLNYLEELINKELSENENK